MDKAAKGSIILYDSRRGRALEIDMQESLSLAQEALKHRVDQIPERMKPHIKMGFHYLAKTSIAQRSEFLSYILLITEKGDSLDRDKAIELTGLDKHTISDVLSSVAMTIGATVDSDVSADDFLEISRSQMFEEQDEAVAREVVERIIARRQALSSGMEDSALVNSTLPSFQALMYEIDVRIRFEDGNDVPRGGVAVAVCNLKTDTTDDLWFQAGSSHIEEIIKTLESALRQLRAAERIALEVK